MLSFVNGFRAVARRQSSRLPAARAVSSHSVQTPLEGNPLGYLHDYVYDVAREQELNAAESSSSEVPSDEVGIVDPEAPADSSTHFRGFPILKGFTPDQFVQPQSFTREGYEKMLRRPYTKRPLLGPDASTSRYLDIFHQMDINPLDECQNSKIMSRFVTTMGKIRGRAETNLTWKNQRRVGKAIRRAKMMGIIPVLSRRTLLAENTRRS